MYNGRRTFIVLPFYYVDEVDGIHKVLPIPFIVDSGSIEAIYLGSGAKNKLKKLNCINDRTDKNGRKQYYRLKGTFHNKDKSLDRPVAEDVPDYYEKPLKGDVRINILGAKGMDALDVNIVWSKISRSY